LTSLNESHDTPDALDGVELLDELRRTYARFVVLPEGGEVAVVLWTVFAHAHDEFQVSPLLTMTSPVKQCGKTQVLRVLRCLVPNPIPASNATPAALFHAVEAMAPTFLLDEADTWVTLDEQTRGFLNSGHTPDEPFLRCSGAFSTWCPKALALIYRGPDDLPPTVRGRSILIAMHRCPRGAVESIRKDRLPLELAPLRVQVASWVDAHRDELRDADPAVPDGLDARQADNWRPLLAIADLAGGDWPRLARLAAVALSPQEEDEEEGINALEDLMEVFALYRLPSALVVGWMNTNKPDRWGGTMTNIRLARLLKPFGIKTKSIWWVDARARSVRGYILSDCRNAFKAYLV
jgi:putative DNA primase/helicase